MGLSIARGLLRRLSVGDWMIQNRKVTLTISLRLRSVLTGHPTHGVMLSLE